MPASQGRDRDLSVAPALAWFAVLLCGALVILDGHLHGLVAIVDHRDTGDEVGPQVAGPAFVQREGSAPDDDLGELASYADPDGEPAPPRRPTVAARRVRTADASAGAGSTAAATAAGHAEATTDTGDEDDGADDDGPAARTAIEDTCVDGTAASCRRWAMDGFYRALGRARAGTGLARISLYGDSVTAEGYIATGMRRRTMKRYGDGGAGFVFLASPSRWYQNQVVRQSQSKGWQIHSIVFNSASDQLHGYGGVSFTGTSGDHVTFKTAKRGPGDAVSRFELYYLASPKGGTADIVVDGEVALTVDSHADTTASAFAGVDLADGAHAIEVRVTRGRLRGFGVTMERASGVVVDSLGVVSNTAKSMGKIDDAHYAEQIAHRDPALVMVLLGANESGWLKGAGAMKQYRQQWEALLARVRKGDPAASCLVLGTLDAGELQDGKHYVARTNIADMIEVERAAAAAQGCAFWDARAFMGGDDAARKWFRKGLMSGDFEHLTSKGGQVIGSGIVEALEAGYAASRSR